MQMHQLMASAILGAAVAAVPVYGQAVQEDADRAAERTDRQIDRAADRAADRIDRAGDQLRTDMDKPGMAGDLALPAGFKLDENGADHSKAIRKTLTEVVEAAFTEDGFDDMVERFVDQDRNRIGKDDLNYDRFNQAVKAFRDNWQAKYGARFDLDADQMFADIRAVSGEVEDPRLAMMNWPVQADSGLTDMARQAGAGVDDATRDEGDRIEDANLEKGRDVALARITGDKGKHLTLSFVDELGGWKLDLPNHLTGQQVLDNVTQCIDRANQMKNDWPADEAQAKQHVGTKLLKAVYGIDKSADKTDAQKANVKIQGEMD